MEIFGQTYNVRAGADPEYVVRLAAYVDAQMREVSASAGPVDSLKTAVLAALNLSDEVFRLREAVARAEQVVLARATKLAGELAATLDE